MIGSKIEGMHDEMRTLGSNPQKLVMVEMPKQGTNNVQTQSIPSILMMKSFNMFQLTGSSPLHPYSDILSLAFWRPSQEDRTIEMLGLS